jgi:hypothetical protein
MTRALCAAVNVASIPRHSSAASPTCASVPIMIGRRLACGFAPLTATAISQSLSMMRITPHPATSTVHSTARMPLPGPAPPPGSSGSAARTRTDAEAYARPTAAAEYTRRCGVPCRTRAWLRICRTPICSMMYSGGSSTAAGRSKIAYTSRVMPVGSPTRRVSSVETTVQAIVTANSRRSPARRGVTAAAAPIAAQ